jgi:polysaccharide export outer membrane protein
MMRKIVYALTILGLFASRQADARQSSSERIQRLESLQSQDALQVPPAASVAGPAFESTVNPAHYYVGPSDVLSVNIWSGQPVSFTLTVTPEGAVIVPTVGEIPVAGKTLADVKTEVGGLVRKKYASFPITVSLIRPRQVIVSVIGNVLNPGQYTLSAADRANRAVDAANRPDPVRQDPLVAEKILLEMARRNIVVKHNDGTRERVDIVKYFAERSDEMNPYLREGDVIVVPKRDPDKNVVAIYGEVNAPGRYEFVEGDSLADLLLIAQDFTARAIRDSVEFSRLSPDGHSMARRIIGFGGGVTENVELEAGDRVVVRARPDLREDYRVTIEGEVRYPGTYPITKIYTKLSDVIRMAGGFTELAALGSATLNRRAVRWDEVQMERLMSLRGIYSAEDSADYLNETNLRLQREIVSTDFRRLIVEGDSSQDVVLQDGDNIVIPSRRNSVYVFGQILRPGHIPFVKGSQIEYYVKMGGGYTDRARREDVRIIKANTRQWIEPSNTQIEEGDQIWIPKEPDRPFGYYMNIASQSAAVLSVIIAMTVLIVQASK